MRTSRQAFDKTIPLLAIAATMTLILLQVPFLERFPAVRVDEAWNANRAWHWLNAGVNTTTIDQGPRGEDVGIGSPPLASGILRLAYAALGLGLAQTRLPSLVFGAILLLATYWTGSLLYDRFTGLLALLLLGLSWVFITSSHLGRPDVILAAFVVLACGLSLWGLRSGRLMAHGMAGFVMALGYDVHQNALIFAAALLVTYVVAAGRAFWRRPALWALVAGALLGSLVFRRTYDLALAFLGLGSSPLPAGVAAGGQGLAGSHRPPLLDLTPTLFLQSLLAEIYYRFDPLRYPLAMILIVAALGFLLWRHQSSDRLLLVFIGVAALLFVLLLQNKTSEYTILLYPFLMLAVAAMFLGLLQRWPGRAAGAGVGAVLVLFLAVSLAQGARLLFSHRHYSYEAVVAQLEQVIPSQARVMGMPTWWLGLNGYDYRSNVTLTDYHYLRGYTLTEGLEAFQPEYLIVDDLWRSRFVDEGYFPENGMGRAVFYLPRQEFAAFLEQRGNKVLEILDPWHGLLQIYAIDWQQP